MSTRTDANASWSLQHLLFQFLNTLSKYILNKVGDKLHPCLNPQLTYFVIKIVRPCGRMLIQSCFCVYRRTVQSESLKSKIIVHCMD